MVRIQTHEKGSRSESLSINPLFARRAEDLSVPRFALPANGMLPETAYQIVHDEAMLDGNARQNLATFVTTWMEPLASQLYRDTFDKNMIDKDEYPLTAAIEERCWRMLADLWHAPDPQSTVGTSAVGSSEACMLGGLALKTALAGRPAERRQERRSANLVMSSAVQVVWEKFANYWDIEPRYVPISEEHPTLDGYQIENYVDENTIGVVAILGLTYIGVYEPVQAIAAALDELQTRTGLDIPIHVDGASGAFVAPFLSPGSGLGLPVAAGAFDQYVRAQVGRCIRASAGSCGARPTCFPTAWFSRVGYLGGEMPTLAINFSRPGRKCCCSTQLPAVGLDGYRRVQQASQDVALHLSSAIADMEPSSSSATVPICRCSRGVSPELHRAVGSARSSNQLREKGWQVPSYPLPDNLSDTTVQRIVIRNGVSLDLADYLLENLRSAATYLESLSSPMPREGRTSSSYHH